MKFVSPDRPEGSQVKQGQVCLPERKGTRIPLQLPYLSPLIIQLKKDRKHTTKFLLYNYEIH